MAYRTPPEEFFARRRLSPEMLGAREVMRAPHNAIGGVTNFPQNSGGGYGMGGGGPRSTQLGRGRIQGYSFNEQGTGRDYIRRHGGLSAQRPSLLNDLYVNQPGVTMGAYDRLQQQRRMDMADPVAGFYASEMGVAQGQGQYDKAGLFSQILQDRVAQQMAGGGYPSPYSTMPQTGFRSSQMPEGGFQSSQVGGDIGQSTQLPMDEMIAPQAPPGIRSTPMEWAYMQTGDNPGEATRIDPRYGVGTVTRSPSTAAFTNGQGSAVGGTRFPGQQGTQSAADFFSEAANRQGTPNRYAIPEPGYGGRTDDSKKSWDAYYSAMGARDKLKGR